MRYYLIGLLIVMVIAQWVVPATMIFEQESILTEGATYKFKTAPFDPSDPFRGSYLTLRFAEARHEIDSSLTFKDKDNVFVNLTRDESGFAVIKNISTTRPDDGDYVVAQTGYESPVWDRERDVKTNKKEVAIIFPFNRFYLEESKAKDADRAYQDSNRDSTQVSYAIVKVRKGKSAIEDVILNGESVRKIVARENEKY